MGKPATNPQIVNAIQRLRELGWDAYATCEQSQWIVRGTKGLLSFQVSRPMLRDAWLATQRMTERRQVG